MKQDRRVHMSIRVLPEVKAEVQRRALEEGRSVSRVVERKLLEFGVPIFVPADSALQDLKDIDLSPGEIVPVDPKTMRPTSKTLNHLIETRGKREKIDPMSAIPPQFRREPSRKKA